MSFVRSVPRTPKSFALMALALASALALGACHEDDMSTGAVTIDDYHNRHPILLTDGPTTLDVFPVGVGSLEAASAADVRGFAQRYAQYGVGRIVILAPAGGGPKIPLKLIDDKTFQFTKPSGSVAGPAYVQALNPPFVPFTSSGNDPGGAFTLK